MRCELLLIEQFRPPVGKVVIELPAGLTGDIESQESEESANPAPRELHEVTGCEAEEAGEATGMFHRDRGFQPVRSLSLDRFAQAAAGLTQQLVGRFGIDCLAMHHDGDLHASIRLSQQFHRRGLIQARKR
jgi:hypothetical protein